MHRRCTTFESFLCKHPPIFLHESFSGITTLKDFVCCHLVIETTHPSGISESSVHKKMDRTAFCPDFHVVGRSKKKSFRRANHPDKQSLLSRKVLANNETVDGLPQGIFDPTFLRPLPSPTEFPVVLDILRLVNKYNAQELFRRALLHLVAIYPTSLPEFLNVPGNVHIEYPDGKLEEYLLVLAAALNFDARWLQVRFDGSF
ncbi:hypothetical protein DFH09DRAFT_1118669 [Mycena vulgaris]|nr:hypothetical protein DFH09DRAFT_1118669 [Mycena vulgaris]